MREQAAGAWHAACSPPLYMYTCGEKTKHLHCCSWHLWTKDRLSLSARSDGSPGIVGQWAAETRLISLGEPKSCLEESGEVQLAADQRPTAVSRSLPKTAAGPR